MGSLPEGVEPPEKVAGAEPIYIKAARTIIAHNVLIDAGYAEGWIIRKGPDRLGPSPYDDPRGYANLITDNLLYCTTAHRNRTLGGRSLKVTGINCGDNAVCSGNVFWDLGQAIEHDSGEPAHSEPPLPLRAMDIVEKNWVLNREQGETAIKILAGGRGVAVRDNIVRNVGHHGGQRRDGIFVGLRPRSGIVLVEGNVIVEDPTVPRVDDESQARLYNTRGIAVQIEANAHPLREISRLLFLDNVVVDAAEGIICSLSSPRFDHAEWRPDGSRMVARGNSIVLLPPLLAGQVPQPREIQISPWDRQMTQSFLFNEGLSETDVDLLSIPSGRLGTVRSRYIVTNDRMEPILIPDFEGGHNGQVMELHCYGQVRISSNDSIHLAHDPFRVSEFGTITLVRLEGLGHRRAGWFEISRAAPSVVD